MSSRKAGRLPVRQYTGFSGRQSPEEALEDIDPEVRDIVRDLNLSGYRTYSSCSGDAYPTAMISISNKRGPRFTKRDYSKMGSIIRRYTDVPFNFYSYHPSSHGGIDIVFKSPLARPLQEEDIEELGDFIGIPDSEVRPLLDNPKSWYKVVDVIRKPWAPSLEFRESIEDND